MLQIQAVRFIHEVLLHQWDAVMLLAHQEVLTQVMPTSAWLQREEAAWLLVLMVEDLCLVLIQVADRELLLLALIHQGVLRAVKAAAHTAVVQTQQRLLL